MLFFNWYGYRLLTAYWQQRADRLLEMQLDQNDYDESSLISIRIPAASLSYSNSSTTFERIDGEIILGDIAYKYVKRRLFNDSVELLCIRNTAAMAMGQVQNEFFRLVNNLTHFPNSKPAGSSDVKKIYSPSSFSYPITAPEPIDVAPAEYPTPALESGHSRPAERPPDTPLFFS